MEAAFVVVQAVEPEPGSRGRTGKLPKLPTFHDGSNEIDSYLQRFERFTLNYMWPKSEWATTHSALLTEKVLDAYSRMADEAMVNYDVLKEALVK